MSIDQGDTFTVLRAVLDTQFWLTTHVIIINLGYSATLVAGMLGVASLFCMLFTSGFDKPTRRLITNIIYGITCFALLFSFFGTVLGGLWADDSWGRFWGWDPKRKRGTNDCSVECSNLTRSLGRPCQRARHCSIGCVRQRDRNLVLGRRKSTRCRNARVCCNWKWWSSRQHFHGPHVLLENVRGLQRNGCFTGVCDSKKLLSQPTSCKFDSVATVSKSGKASTTINTHAITKTLTQRFRQKLRACAFY